MGLLLAILVIAIFPPSSNSRNTSDHVKLECSAVTNRLPTDISLYGTSLSRSASTHLSATPVSNFFHLHFCLHSLFLNEQIDAGGTLDNSFNLRTIKCRVSTTVVSSWGNLFKASFLCVMVIVLCCFHRKQII